MAFTKFLLILPTFFSMINFINLTGGGKTPPPVRLEILNYQATAVIAISLKMNVPPEISPSPFAPICMLTELPP